MNDDGLDREREFFVTGVNTYLDVDDAIVEFRRLVEHKCRSVVSARLNEVNQECGMDWTVGDLNDYFEKANDFHYIGKQMEVKELGKLYFCLRLSREIDSNPIDAFVYLYRKQRDIATGLWEIAGASASVTYKGRNNLGFGQPIPKDKIPDFEDYLDKAVTGFLVFINKCGGLKKYLAPGPK